MKNKQKILALIISIAAAHLAGLIGSIFTAPNIAGWYAALTKPSFTPPDWLFAPAWLVLYTLMGIAAYLVWRKRNHEEARFSLWLYGAHLAVNALWSIVFFGLHDVAMALLVIVALWVMIFILVVVFGRQSKTAGYLLWPYVAWVSYATVLNAAIWALN